MTYKPSYVWVENQVAPCSIGTIIVCHTLECGVSFPILLNYIWHSICTNLSNESVNSSVSYLLHKCNLQRVVFSMGLTLTVITKLHCVHELYTLA